MSPRLGRLLAVVAIVLGLGSEVAVLATEGLRGDSGGAPTAVELLPVLAFCLVGALLLARRSQNRVGWLVAAVGTAATFSVAATGVASWGIRRSVGPEGFVALELVGTIVFELAIGLALVVLPAVFPDGRAHSPRWRWLPVTALVLGAVSTVSLLLLPDEVVIDEQVHANPLGIESLEPVLAPIGGVSLAVMWLLFLPALGSLVLRFRRSRGVERLQLRWFVTAMAFMGATLVVHITWIGAASAGLVPDPGELVSDVMLLVAITAIPTAIGTAVLRYRLYDIDRVISRSVSYVLVLAVLATTYLVLVVGLGGAARAITGEASDLVVALSTLTVAALFQPLRTRVRSIVDRRFNRARYDAARTIDAFGRELRDEVSLDAVMARLTTVSSASFQPSLVGVTLVGSVVLG